MTNIEFERFVSESGYITVAERVRIPPIIRALIRACSCPARSSSAAPYIALA